MSKVVPKVREVYRDLKEGGVVTVTEVHDRLSQTVRFKNMKGQDSGCSLHAFDGRFEPLKIDTLLA